MPAPSIGTLENAADAAFWSADFASAVGLTQLYSKTGVPLATETANGCTASALIDGSGNVIISFQGTTTMVQDEADAQMLEGDPPSSIGALTDALAFTRTVQQAAAGLGIPASNIYVTGHSLGGTLAEYVASQTGLPGVSFAGSGLPDYVAPSTPAANFTSYVEHGDSYANFSSDGSEHVLSGAHQDHYGQLVFLGSPANDAITNTIIADVHALLPATFTGTLDQALEKLEVDFRNNLLTIHTMRKYASSIASLPPPHLTGPAFPEKAQSPSTHLFLHQGLS